MRQVWLNKDDFEMFHQDISPLDYEFFRTHVDTFKRMWKEQTKRYWSLFLNAFEHFIWKHGCVKDFPMKSAEVHKYIDDILQYIRDQFVTGKVSSAKNLIYDCVVVTQNRHCITILDRAAYAQNPFYMKETREVFRQLFGAPSDKKTYMKVLCGLPMYVKFAGSVVVALRRWMDAPEINPEDEAAKKNYFDNIFKHHKPISEFMGEDLSRLKITDKDIAAVIYPGLTRGCFERAEASTMTETSETEKKKRKKKKKTAKSSNDPALTNDSTPAGDGQAKADKSSETSLSLLTPKNTDPLKTDTDSPPKTGTDESVQDKASELTNPDGAKKTGSNSDSDTFDKERGTNNDSDKSSDQAKLTETLKSKTKDCPNKQGAESAVGSTPLKVSNSVEFLSETKGTSAMKQKTIKKSISKENTESGRGEAEPVAKDMAAGTDSAAARRKLHTCGLCGREEVTAKTFKRCQKCRGKSNPKYYCSRDCQVKDWKTHKLDHKDEP